MSFHIQVDNEGKYILVNFIIQKIIFNYEYNILGERTSLIIVFIILFNICILPSELFIYIKSRL